MSGVLSLAPNLAACATPAATASDELVEIQQRLREDKARSDWQAFLIDATRLSEFVHGSPGAQLEIARAQLNLGDATAAKATVARVLAMGAAHPILASPLFLPVVEALGPLRAASEKIVTSAAVALTIADPELLPEDIDFDAKRRRFFVTSIRRGEVAELRADGTVRTFALSPHRWPMMALKIDSRRRRLWATEAAVDGFAWVPENEWGRSAVLEYDLDDGTLLRRIEGPPRSSLGDMALLGNGEPLVSDGQGGGIYQVTAAGLTRLDHGEFVSPQTPAYCTGDRTLFVPDYVRGLAAMDVATGSVRWIRSDGKVAWDETDGLYCVGRALLAVQNGATHPRALADRREGSTAGSITLIERRPAGDFTHGVVVERRFYYLANAGWDAIDEKGRPKVGVAASHPLLMVSDVLAGKTRRDGGHDLDSSPNARVDVSKPRRRASST